MCIVHQILYLRVIIVVLQVHLLLLQLLPVLIDIGVDAPLLKDIVHVLLEVNLAAPSSIRRSHGVQI